MLVLLPRMAATAPAQGKSWPALTGHYAEAAATRSELDHDAARGAAPFSDRTERRDAQHARLTRRRRHWTSTSVPRTSHEARQQRDLPTALLRQYFPERGDLKRDTLASSCEAATGAQRATTQARSAGRRGRSPRPSSLHCPTGSDASDPWPGGSIARAVADHAGLTAALSGRSHRSDSGTHTELLRSRRLLLASPRLTTTARRAAAR